MDRRTALILTMLLGGFAPQSLLAQEAARRKAATKPRFRVKDADPLDEESQSEPRASSTDQDLPDLAEPGRQKREWDISGYTKVVTNKAAPQTAILDWIFRRTGSGPWHDDKPSVLSASKSRILAYHNDRTLKQVADVVDRFVNARADKLTIRVRFIVAADTRWRYTVYSRLNQNSAGPQGQRIWTVPPEVAAQILALQAIDQRFTLLDDRSYDMFNGQNLEMQTAAKVPYAGTLQGDGGAGVGPQPKTEQLEEGVDIKLSPLLGYDGDTLDLALELSSYTVKSLHRTRVLAPRSVGTNEAVIDVPEVAGSRLNQTIKDWPIDQTLIISAGVQPGILLPNKKGFLNLRLPGTVPNQTELLVFLEAKAQDRGRPSSRD